ncbi:MAG TPA: alpha/beta fold hydrolase [Casimicrobiaceae bacterium]|nr:alpha/beta fold hydrolase [Casimicrobiaceae bacterium]
MDNGFAATTRQTRNDAVTPTIVIVPGLRDHMPEHWQTLLEKKLSRVACVPRRTHDKLSCAMWIADLDRTLGGVAGPVVLVAHSAGCMIAVHWAREHKRPIQGALLAAPPDFESPLPEGYPAQQVLRDNGWIPTPRSPLPFPSIVAASTNDPLGRFERVAELAAAWESRLVDVGAVGHLNPASGYREWPRALDLIGELGGSSALLR